MKKKFLYNILLLLSLFEALEAVSKKTHNNLICEIKTQSSFGAHQRFIVKYEHVTILTDFTQEQKIFVDAFTHAYKDEQETFERLGIYTMHDYFNSEFKQEFLEFARAFNDLSPIYLIRARHNEKTVGFVTFNRESIPGQIYIRWIAVSPTYGRLGIGQELVDCIKKLLPETKQLVLVAYKLDKPAINFWSNKMHFTLSDYSRKEYDATTFQGFTFNIPS